MSDSKGPLVADCAKWLTIVSELFGARMSILLAPDGLTQSQFSILHHVVGLRSDTGSTVSTIAAAVEVEQPAVTKTLAKFQNLGLVEIMPSPTDRRAKLVRATPAAGALIGKIYQDMGPDLFQVFSTLDADALQQFSRQLKQLGQWLDSNRLDGAK
jgi:DNA-binding MarR family transcriptional regulator